MNATTPVEIAILKREEDNDAAEAAFEHARGEREFDAREAITDPDGLKSILNDDWLAYGLSRQQRNLERAVSELSKLQIEYRVPDDALIYLRGLVQATAQIERDLFVRKLEELEDV